MQFPNYAKLIISLLLPQLAGLIGTVFTTPAISGWYSTLARPEFAPPNWIFAPVWTTLFVLMGIAAFLVWRTGLERRAVQIALGVFIFQLVLNTLWSILFFGMQNPGAAFFEIIILWLAIAATIFSFTKVSKTAAWLLAPYILWVTFAAYLNFAIWSLNTSSVFVADATYMCDEGKTIHATYYESKQPHKVEPGEPPVPTGTVDLVFSDSTKMKLSQTLSASGVRFANADESLVFWNKGDEALVMRNNAMDLAYTNCHENTPVIQKK